MTPADLPAGAQEADAHQHRPRCGAASGARHQCSLRTGQTRDGPARRSSFCDGLEMIQGRCASSVKVLTPEVHPYRYPRRSEALSEAHRRRCATAVGNVNKRFTRSLSATPQIPHRPHAGRSGLTATVGPWRLMTSKGLCHDTCNTDGQPDWAPGLREHVIEGVHPSPLSRESKTPTRSTPAPSTSRLPP